MLYTRKSFSVSSSANKSTMCTEKGHSGFDSRGNCYCCGENIKTIEQRLAPMCDPIAETLWLECVGGPFDGVLFGPDAPGVEYMPGIRLYAITHGTQRVFYRPASRREKLNTCSIVFDGFDR